MMLLLSHVSLLNSFQERENPPIISNPENSHLIFILFISYRLTNNANYWWRLDYSLITLPRSGIKYKPMNFMVYCPGLYTWIRKLLLNSFLRHLTWWYTFMCCKIPNISIGSGCANHKALPHCHPYLDIMSISILLNDVLKNAVCKSEYTPQNMLYWVKS